MAKHNWKMIFSPTETVSGDLGSHPYSLTISVPGQSRIDWDCDPEPV